MNSYVATYETFGQAILGIDAGRNMSGEYNTILGYSAGSRWGSAGTGSYNTFVGPEAGSGGTYKLADRNICIGYQAGYNQSGSDQLYIDNSSAGPTGALIYGDFALDRLRLNGNVTINRQNYSGYGLIVSHLAGQSPTYQALWVYGDAYATGNFVSGSDERWKKKIEDLKPVLTDVLNIHPVYFNWRTDEYKDMDFTDDRQIGFIAQDVEKYFPEMIRYDHNGYKLLDYSRMTVVLLQAIKEQQQQIQSQQSELQSLRDEMEQVKTLITGADSK